MVELRTRYLGLDLPSPLVASASPLTGTLDGLRRLEAAGAAAVVLRGDPTDDGILVAPSGADAHGDRVEPQ